MQEVEELGGMTKAVALGCPSNELKKQQLVGRLDRSGKAVIVGVNKYRLEQEERVEVRDIDNSAVREAQIYRLNQVRQNRDNTVVKKS